MRKGPTTERGSARSDGRTDPKVPVGKPGNRLSDIAWGKRHHELGEFERIGEDEVGIPFGALWRWKFLQEDFDAWLEVEGIFKNRFDNACTGTSYVRDKEGRYVVDMDNAVLTRPCMRAAVKGSTVCPPHGGKLPQTKAAARARLEGVADQVVERLLGVAFDPLADPKVIVQACAQLLDRAGIKGGVEIDITLPGWQEGLKALFEGQYDAPE